MRRLRDGQLEGLGALTPNERAEVWQGVVQSYISQTPNLNAAQVEALNTAMSTMVHVPDKRLDQIVGQLMSVLLIAIPAGLLLTYGLTVYLPATHKAYAIDTKVDVPAEIYRDAPFTVVLFARSSCGVCERSKEIFSVALNRAREQQHVNVTLVVPTTLSDGDRSYGRDLGIDPERVVHLPSSALLHVVPTILVVDRTGTIRFARSGVPPLLRGPQLANEVLAAMQGS